MILSPKIKDKLHLLPDKPGVYIMRDKAGRIIYVGKAASLRNRVRHYFQAATLRSADPKLRGLIRTVDDFEFLVVPTEADAILTEGRLIKEYRPRFNVAFKDDKRFLMIRVDTRDPFPRFEPCRMDRRDGASYFGPYSNSDSARAALEFLEKRLGLRHCRPEIPDADDHRHCHADIIRLCTAPCIGKISREDYLARVNEGCAFLRGERPDILQGLQEAMQAEAAAMNFEKAAALRDTLLHLRRVVRERIQSRKTLEIKQDEAALGLVDIKLALNLPTLPKVIECFDISNISGTHAVASMVSCVDGLPQRSRYRHFRIKTVEGSDDPRMMAEVIRRRYSRLLEEKQPLPDLVLVDGGITQLLAARAELRELGLGAQPSAGLAKRFEEVVVGDDLATPTVRFPRDSHALKVLQRIRDEAHRFALTYHRNLRLQRMRDSLLDQVEGIGEKRKKLLLSHFGSVARLRRAAEEDIAAIPGIGPVMARAIHEKLARK